MNLYARKLVKRFEQAVREEAFAGAQPPEDRPYLELELREAKNALLDYLDKVVKK